MNLSHVLKKVGRGSSHDLISNWYFLNLHALGYLKPVTVFLYWEFGSTSPSARSSVRTLLKTDFWPHRSNKKGQILAPIFEMAIFLAPKGRGPQKYDLLLFFKSTIIFKNRTFAWWMKLKLSKPKYYSEKHGQF
jgi:hypothetical protein